MPKIRSKTRILPVMIGTAGHVDHGKTALVRNLTGCETDRLQEEKQRGLSINLGFAACSFPGRRLAGVVDVPGHETFIRNMVAGAASMNIVMLVVAADDGVMPQTIEHMQIVKLLGTPRILAVITKVDLVENDLVELVKEDVAEFLAGMGFPDVPTVCVSNVTFDGLSQVREVLEGMIQDTVEHDSSDRTFRMNVERAFSAKGYGTIVTGIPTSGNIKVGDQVELMPARKMSGIRFIQSYQLDADSVESSVCGALNLRHIDLDQVERGMTVAVPGAYQATTAVIAMLQNVSESFTLKQRAEVKFHAGTTVVTASIRLVEGDKLPPGEKGIAQINLQEPVVLAAGDRYLIRSPSPVSTVGGGTILCTRGAVKLNRKSPHVQDRLARAYKAFEAEDFFFTELLLGPSGIVEEADLHRFTQRIPEASRALIRERTEAGDLIDLGGGGWLVSSRISEIARTMASALRRYHQDRPYSWGMEPANACKVFNLSSGSFPALSRALCENPEIVLKHDRLALSSFRPTISQQQMQYRDTILDRVKACGARPPARGDLARDLGIPEQDMRILTKLMAEEKAVKLVRTNLLLYSLYEEFRVKLLDLFKENEIVPIAAFRDATGVSRNMAEALLEAYDAEGLTRRVESGRVLIKAQEPGY